MKIKLLLLFITAHQMLVAQNIGIGTTAPHASAQLDITSNTKGLLVPRLTLTQRNAITTPAAGLLIFQTDNIPGFYYYNGASWIQFSTGSATNYWTANGAHIFSNNTGNVGIGIANPLSALHIHSPNNTFNSYIRLTHQTSGTSFSDGAYMGLDGNNLLFRNSETGNILFSNSGGDRLIINPAGNVGIGIGAGNPTDKLHISGSLRLDGNVSSPATIKMFAAQPADNSLILFYNQPSAIFPSAIFGYDGNDDRLLIACNAGNMSLNNTGLGIGTSAPAAKLHVSGNVMIGSGNPGTGYLLSVNGKMISEEVRVALYGTADWPDYVFENNYQLRPLAELEKLIRQQKHLPGIPAAAQVKKEGFDLGDMNRRLLEKIEELTLYMIQQDKKINALEEKLQSLQATHQ